MSLRIVNSKSPAGCSVSKARTARLRRSPAIARSVCTAKRPVSVTSSSMCSPSAAASTSKPGPRLAEDAGTRTSRRLCIDGALDRFDAGLAGHDRAGLRERRLRVLEPVAGQHAGDPLGAVGALGEQSGDAGRARGLAEDALLAREKPVG